MRNNEDKFIDSHIIESLPLYIDDMLDAQEKAIVEDHLLHCLACSDVKRELLDVKRCLSEMGPAVLPEQFEPRLRAALQKAEKTRKARSRRWKPLGAVAAVFVVGLLSYNMYTGMLPDSLDQYGGAMLKSAALPQPQSEAALADDAVVDLSVYQDLIQSKLSDYSYEILDISNEESEFILLIKKDKTGNAINREFVIQFANGQISSEDNWLNIAF